LIACILLLVLRRAGGWRRVIQVTMRSSGTMVLFAIILSMTLLGLVDGVFYYAVPLLFGAAITGLLAANFRLENKRLK
jgi:hypothetical protein